MLGTLAITLNHIALHLPVVPVLLVAAALIGSATALFNPAERSLLKAIVAPESLSQAMAINQTRYSLGTVGGPLLGAALHAIRHIGVFLFDLVTYVFAFLTFRRIRAAAAQPQPTDTPASTSYSDTFAVIRADQVLWAIVWFAPILNFSMSAMLNSTFTYLSSNATTLGAFQSTFGVLGLIGGAGSTALVARIRGGVGLMLTIGLFCVAFGGLAVHFTPVTCFVLLGLFSRFLPLFNVILSGYFLARIPREFVGKASAIMVVTAMGFMPVGTWVSGALIAHFSFTTANLVTTSIFIPASLLFLCNSKILSLGGDQGATPGRLPFSAGR